MNKNEDNVREFWERVKSLLKQNGKTQIDFCKDNNILLQSFRNKVSRNFAPTTDEVIMLSRYLNVSCDYLLTGSDFGVQNRASNEEIKAALLAVLEML